MALLQEFQDRGVGTTRRNRSRLGGWELVLFAAEEEEEFDDEDDDDGEFEDEAAGLIELINHEAVELARVAEFLVDESAVVGHADFGGGQVVETSIEHIAQEFDGVVHFFGPLHYLEPHGAE